MSNGLAIGCQLAYEAVGNAFVDRTGNFADFTNHGGGCTFADDGSWDTGRVVITPGDGVSWLELAKPLDGSNLHFPIPGNAFTLGVVFKLIGETGADYQDIVDFGDEFYVEEPYVQFASQPPPPYFYGGGASFGGGTAPRPAVGVHCIYIVTYNPNEVIGDNIAGYLNGVQFASAFASNNNTDEDPVTVGDYYSGGDPGNFAISQLVKWDRVLSADEQTAFYNGGAGLRFDQWDSGGPIMISDAFRGTGILDNHLSDQNKPWVNIFGSLSLGGSGLTTDNIGTGKYYLDDPTYGVISPPRVDLFLNLPVIPVPDEASDMWLFVFGAGADEDSRNFLSLQIECPPSHVYKATALSVDVDNGQDFTPWVNLNSPPSKISIDPQTQKFYIDDVLFATLGNAPTWGADSRVGIKMDFLTGLNNYATSISANSGSAIPSAPSGVTVTAGDMQALLQWAPNAGGDAVLFYNVYVALAASGPYVLTRNVNASVSHAVLTSLGDGTTYYFKVGAVNSEGESSLSSAVSVTPSAPALLPHTGNAMRMYMYGHS